MSPFERVLRDLLTEGHVARFRAVGDSMHPAIRDGELVDIVPCDVSTLRRGDIVLAAMTRGLTLHRIVRISPDSIITRGDNASGDDGSITSASILGRAMNQTTRNHQWRFAARSVKIIRFAASVVRRLRSAQLRFQR